MLPFLGALLIGVMLGLMGSGGSILTVPVLVYLLGHEDKAAIAESLGIVGGIALIGIVPYARSRQVDWRSVAFFGIPGMAGTYGGAWLAALVPGAAQLVLFACVMLLSAWLMFRNPAKRPAQNGDVASGSEVDEDPPARHALWQISLEGFAVGVLTGLVGVGGGFLIVPALVILGGLSMRTAVGTSLAVIALKSLVGFYKYLGVLDALDLQVDWRTVGLFVSIGIVGTMLGQWVSVRLDQTTLRRAFAAFLVAMGLFVLGKEGPKLLAQPEPLARAVAKVERTAPARLVQNARKTNVISGQVLRP